MTKFEIRNTRLLWTSALLPVAEWWWIFMCLGVEVVWAVSPEVVTVWPMIESDAIVAPLAF